MPVILGRSRALTSLNNQTWVNVGHRVLPSGLERGKTVAFLRDRALFLGDKLLAGTHFLVGLCSIKYTPPGICSYHSVEEIHPQEGNGDMPSWYSFVTQH